MAAASEVPGPLAVPASHDTALRVLPAGHRCGQGTHSTVADGRRVCWTPTTPARVAVDAELAAGPVPPALAARWGSADPDVVWPRWCWVECVAKLTDTPVLLLARTRPEPGHPDRPVRLGTGPTAARMRWRPDRVADLVLVRAVLEAPDRRGSALPDPGPSPR